MERIFSRHLCLTMKIEVEWKVVVLFVSLILTTEVKARSSILDFVVDSDCHFDYSKYSGEIQSPNFPLDYPENTICKWTITAPTNDHIVLQFISPFSVVLAEFAIEILSKCSTDQPAVVIAIVIVMVGFLKRKLFQTQTFFMLFLKAETEQNSDADIFMLSTEENRVAGF